MSTPGAIQHLIKHVKGMDAGFFSRSIMHADSETTYNNVVLTISNAGYSSGTNQGSLHFLVDLGAYQPTSVREYGVWVDDPKEHDFKANQAAVVAALESLIEKGTWNSSMMVSMAA